MNALDQMMADLSWSRTAVGEAVFLAGLALVPHDEREGFITGLKLAIWEADQAKKS